MKHAWIIFWTLSIDMMFFHVVRMAPGVVSDQIGRDLAINGMQLGLLLSLFFYAFGLLQIPAGLIVDALSARWVVAVGLGVAAAGQFLFGWSHLLWLVMLGRVLTGLGVSGIFVAMTKVIARSFAPDAFATIHGFSSSVHNTGALLATVPLVAAAGWLGWRGAMIGIGGLALSAGLISWRILPAESGPRSAVDWRGSWDGLRQLLRRPDTRLTCLLFLGVYSPYLAFTGMWGMPFLMAHYGLDRVTASQHMLWYAASPILFTPILGYLSDRVLGSRRTVLFPVVLMGAALWAILAIAPWAIPGPLLSAFLLLLSGASTAFGLAFAVVRELNPLSQIGLAIGVVNTASYVGVSVMQAGFGWLLDWQTGGRGASMMATRDPGVLMVYRWSAGVSAVCFVLAFVAVLLLPETHPVRRLMGQGGRYL